MQPNPNEQPNATKEPPQLAGLLLDLERTRSALDEAAIEKEEILAKLRSADLRIDLLTRKLDEATARLDGATRRADELSFELKATNTQLDEAQRGEAELRQLLNHAQEQVNRLLRVTGRSRRGRRKTGKKASP